MRIPPLAREKKLNCAGAVFIGLTLLCGLRTSLAAQDVPGHAVNAPELPTTVARADKITVYKGVLLIDEHGKTFGEPVLYSSTNPRDIRELSESVTVAQPESWSLCACVAPVEISLSRKGKTLGSIRIADDLTIGFSKWSGDAKPADEQKLLQWFDSRGIAEPRTNLEHLRTQEQAERAASDRWFAAMPPGLRPLWPVVLRDPTWQQSPPDAPKVSANVLDPVLANEYPDMNQRILSLFSWFGSGSGRWSGYYAWEDVPSRILLEYSAPQLVGALQGAPLTDVEVEGATRFFVGYAPDALFRPPGDRTLIDQLPDELKRTLLAYVAGTGDQQKLDATKKAFQLPDN